MKQMSLSALNLFPSASLGAAASGTAVDLGPFVNVNFRTMKAFASVGAGNGTVAVHFQQSDASSTGFDLIAGASIASLGSAADNGNGFSQIHFIPTQRWLRAVVVPTGSATVFAGALGEARLI